MFGLMKKSEHERICRNLHSHINHHAEINRKHCSEIEDLKKKLVLENRRATYWKMKFLEPDKEPIVLGSKEDVEYIKREGLLSIGLYKHTLYGCILTIWGLFLFRRYFFWVNEVKVLFGQMRALWMINTQ